VWPCHTADPCDTSQKQSCSPICPCCTTSRKINWRSTYTFLYSDERWPPSHMWPCHFGDPAANLDQQSYSPRCGGPVLNHRLRLCCRRGPRSLSQAPNICLHQARLPPQGSSAPVQVPPSDDDCQSDVLRQFSIPAAARGQPPGASAPLLGHSWSWERRRQRIEPPIRRPEGSSCGKRPSQLPCSAPHRPRWPSCSRGAGLAPLGAGPSLRITAPARRRSPRQAATHRAGPPAG
jgi:hypothetical protein